MNKNAPALLTISGLLLSTQSLSREGCGLVSDPSEDHLCTFRGAAVGGGWGWPAVADEGIPLLSTLRVTVSFLAPGLQP